jgi:hypothetical protein
MPEESERAVALQPGRGALRAARSLLVAVPSVALGVAAHVAAGGCVTAGGVVLTGSILLPATWSQLSRQRSTGFLLAWLTLGQVLGHGALELCCHGPEHVATAGSSTMLALHVVAVGLASLLLARGDAGLWRTARSLTALGVRLRRLAARLTSVGTRPVLRVPAPAAPGPAPMTWHDSPWCSPQPVRRGPPVSRPCA